MWEWMKSKTAGIGLVSKGSDPGVRQVNSRRTPENLARTLLHRLSFEHFRDEFFNQVEKFSDFELKISTKFKIVTTVLNKKTIFQLAVRRQQAPVASLFSTELT